MRWKNCNLRKCQVLSPTNMAAQFVQALQSMVNSVQRDEGDRTDQIFRCLKKMAFVSYKENVFKRIKYVSLAIRCLELGPASGFESSKEEALAALRLCKQLLEQVAGSNGDQLQALLNTWGERFFEVTPLKSTKYSGRALLLAVSFRHTQLMLDTVRATKAAEFTTAA